MRLPTISMNNNFDPDLWHQMGDYRPITPVEKAPPKPRGMVMRADDPHQIWFLTAIVVREIIKGPRGEIKTKRDERTFGYYRGFHRAYQAVKENRCNMHECLYNFLVMERIGEGVHALAEDQQWFEWSGKNWKPCRKPTWARGLTNWALG